MPQKPRAQHRGGTFAIFIQNITANWTSAVLGGIQVPLSFNDSDHKHCGDGEECACNPGWYPIAGVSHFYSSSKLFLYYFFVAMPTGQRGLFQPTHKAFRVHKLFGPIKSTMDIVHYLLTLLRLSRSLLNYNLQLILLINGFLAPFFFFFQILRFGRGKVIT